MKVQIWGFEGSSKTKSNLECFLGASSTNGLNWGEGLQSIQLVHPILVIPPAMKDQIWGVKGSSKWGWDWELHRQMLWIGGRFPIHPISPPNSEYSSANESSLTFPRFIQNGIQIGLVLGVSSTKGVNGGMVCFFHPSSKVWLKASEF
jgi:hypothetical protein